MRFTVIGTFAGRRENSLPLLKRLYIDSTRRPDEALLMCEDDDDQQALIDAYWELYELELLDEHPPGLKVIRLPTPRVDGAFAVIPYAHKINRALDLATGDAVVYLDNNSDPKPTKYQTMIEGLEANPYWGATYCTQQRTGYVNQTFLADGPVADGFCALNYTQVMHRLTADRWPLEMALADPDLADGYFWRRLHVTLGSFYPVGGAEVLDEHHMPTPTAAGLYG